MANKHLQVIIINLTIFLLSDSLASAQQKSGSNLSFTPIFSVAQPFNIDPLGAKLGFKIGLNYENKRELSQTAFTSELSYIQFRYKRFNSMNNLIMLKGGFGRYFAQKFFVGGNLGFTMWGSGFYPVGGLNANYSLKATPKSSLTLLMQYDAVFTGGSYALAHFISVGIGYKFCKEKR
jgi:hypothetical protein